MSFLCILQSDYSRHVRSLHLSYSVMILAVTLLWIIIWCSDSRLASYLCSVHAGLMSHDFCHLCYGVMYFVIVTVMTNDFCHYVTV